MKVAVPSGTVTHYTNVWAVDSEVSDSAIFQVFDPSDGTLIIGDENRSFRKIGNLTGTPSQSEVMEADYPANLYQAQFTNLSNSATQEGFGASGNELIAISCEGNFVSGVTYSILLKHTDALSDVIQYGATAPTVSGDLFDPSGFWKGDPTAGDLTDVICDNTATNPHSGGLTLWTFQPSGTASRWEWFDISLGPPPASITVTALTHPLVNRVWQIGEDLVSRVSEPITVTASGDWTLTASPPYVTFNNEQTLTGNGNAIVTVSIADEKTFRPGMEEEHIREFTQRR